MPRYKVTIKAIEEFDVYVDADEYDYAIAEAFDNRYKWICRHTADKFDIEVKEQAVPGEVEN